MARVIQICSNGGPSVLKVAQVEVGLPGPGQVRLVQDAIGINYVDALVRKGLYPMPLPAIPGFEAAGTIDAVGPEVAGFSPGDRAAYFFNAGAYTTASIVPEAALVRLPHDIDNDTAATFLAKGLTAWMGLRALYRLRATDSVLILGASGSVGSILSRWAMSLGATVVGVAGSASKLARVQAGATHALWAGDRDILAKIRKIAPGGFDIVYDFVGQATFALAAAAVRDGGVIAQIGAASGHPSPGTGPLAVRGVEVRSGGTPQYVRGAAAEQAATELWDAFRTGMFNDIETVRYNFDDIAQAHLDMDQRRLFGLPLLVAHDLAL
jgi:NADPH:quinone reductase